MNYLLLFGNRVLHYSDSDQLVIYLNLSTDNNVIYSIDIDDNPKLKSKNKKNLNVNSKSNISSKMSSNFQSNTKSNTESNTKSNTKSNTESNKDYVSSSNLNFKPRKSKSNNYIFFDLTDFSLSNESYTLSKTLNFAPVASENKKLSNSYKEYSVQFNNGTLTIILFSKKEKLDDFLNNRYFFIGLSDKVKNNIYWLSDEQKPLKIGRSCENSDITIYQRNFSIKDDGLIKLNLYKVNNLIKLDDPKLKEPPSYYSKEKNEFRPFNFKARELPVYSKLRKSYFIIKKGINYNKKLLNLKFHFSWDWAYILTFTFLFLSLMIWSVKVVPMMRTIKYTRPLDSISNIQRIHSFPLKESISKPPFLIYNSLEDDYCVVIDYENSLASYSLRKYSRLWDIPLTSEILSPIEVFNHKLNNKIVKTWGIVTHRDLGSTRTKIQFLDLEQGIFNSDFKFFSEGVHYKNIILNNYSESNINFTILSKRDNAIDIEYYNNEEFQTLYSMNTNVEIDKDYEYLIPVILNENIISIAAIMNNGSLNIYSLLNDNVYYNRLFGAFKEISYSIDYCYNSNINIIYLLVLTHSNTLIYSAVDVKGKVLWSNVFHNYELKHNESLKIHTFDINNNGTKELVFTKNNTLYVVNGKDGSLLWKINEESNIENQQFDITFFDITNTGYADLFYTFNYTNDIGHKVSKLIVRNGKTGKMNYIMELDYEAVHQVFVYPTEKNEFYNINLLILKNDMMNLYNTGIKKLDNNFYRYGDLNKLLSEENLHQSYNTNLINLIFYLSLTFVLFAIPLFFMISPFDSLKLSFISKLEKKFYLNKVCSKIRVGGQSH